MVDASFLDKYDVIFALTRTHTGLDFGRLWHGDVVSAKKDLDHIIGKGKLKLGVIQETKGVFEEEEENFLAVAFVNIHRMDL